MYLFLVRAFNDIDHITPIVWKMWQDNYPVALFCWSPDYDLHRDYRLRFLIKQGIKVNYIFDEFDQSLGFIHRITRFISRVYLPLRTGSTIILQRHFPPDWRPFKNVPKSSAKRSIKGRGQSFMTSPGPAG